MITSCFVSVKFLLLLEIEKVGLRTFLCLAREEKTFLTPSPFLPILRLPQTSSFLWVVSRVLETTFSWLFHQVVQQQQQKITIINNRSLWQHLSFHCSKAKFHYYTLCQRAYLILIITSILNEKGLYNLRLKMFYIKSVLLYFYKFYLTHKSYQEFNRFNQFF